MARTKGKPGPKPKYGEREEIHVLVPVDDLNYIRSVTQNTTEWVIGAIQEKRQRDTASQPDAQPPGWFVPEPGSEWERQATQYHDTLRNLVNPVKPPQKGQ
jgi:hypothetical protein